MSHTMIEQPSLTKKGNISIRPYVDPDMTNMGLERYGLALHDGVYHEEQLACIDINGKQRYITGLNEFAPDVKKLPTELREAKVKEIRKVVASLERDLAQNIIKEEDEEFWNKVQLLKSDNNEFWSKIVVRCGNTPVFLDPENNPYDLIKLYAIEAGGFCIIARSYEEARAMSVPPKFYLDKYVDTIATRLELKKLRNSAISELETLFDKNQNKLFYILKCIDINSIQYKKSTPNDLLYENADKFINGEGSERNKKRAAQEFLNACELSMEDLKMKAIIKDATFLKVIVLKSDGMIYHHDSNTMLGRNPSEVLLYLKNPLNDQVLEAIMKQVEKQWDA